MLQSAMDLPPLASACPQLAPGVRLQVDPVTQCGVLLSPEGILELNETAHEIVQRCNGVATLEQLVQQLAREFDAPPEEIRSDVEECLAGLQKRQLLRLA